MYPVIQKENEKFKVVGITSIPQLSCCNEKEYNRIEEKKDKSEFDKEFLKLKPLKKIPEGFIMNSKKNYYYEDGEFKEGNE